MSLDFVFSSFTAPFNDDVCELHLIKRKKYFLFRLLSISSHIRSQKQLSSSGRLGSQKRLKAAVSATLIAVIIQCLFWYFHHTSLFDAFKMLVATICIQGWKYCVQWTKILTIKLILSTLFNYTFKVKLLPNNWVIYLISIQFHQQCVLVDLVI